MSKLTQSTAWQALQAHYDQVKDLHMRDLFEQDPQRFEKFHARMDDILVDFSKNRITDETLALLCALARAADVESWRDRMFSGEAINNTEFRPVLHTALRNRSNTPVLVNNEDVMPKVNRVLEQMRGFSKRVHDGDWRGYTGQKIKDVINIGIGGSDLGPHMVCEAMKPYARHGINAHFVSNVDPTHLTETLKRVEPETTLFVISSKSFTTQETMLNAHAAREWFVSLAGDDKAVASHFVAVTTNIEAATAFGISPDNMFEFWDWVGGRYSLWSAIGLPIVLYLGMERFEQLLEGAHAMDQHFQSTPLEQNIPVLLALLGIWYNNFFGAQSQAIIAYSQYLSRLATYLQQLDMESNGKTINREGERVDMQTGPIIWGEAGTNSQHAFFQLFHQGTKMIPVDFLMPTTSANPLGNQNTVLLSNFLAQTRALMHGKTRDEVLQEMKQAGIDDATIEHVLPHRVFEGNRPSNSILFEQLDPRTLGALIAMYEHKVFVQGIIWNINSFDQWGVELGKQLAGDILQTLTAREDTTAYDSSTNNLIHYCLMNKFTE